MKLIVGEGSLTAQSSSSANLVDKAAAFALARAKHTTRTCVLRACGHVQSCDDLLGEPGEGIPRPPVAFFRSIVRINARESFQSPSRSRLYSLLRSARTGK